MAQTRKFDFTFRVVIYAEDAKWIAHCLETDIVAEGDTPGEALRDLIDLNGFQIRTALEDGDLKSIFRPAPPEIMYNFYAAMKPVKTPGPTRTGTTIERFEARQFAFV